MTDLTPKRAWAAWKGFARRAAEVQAHVVFFVLYFAAVAPMGLLRRGRSRTFRRQAPGWLEHGGASPDLASARRQS